MQHTNGSTLKAYNENAATVMMEGKEFTVSIDGNIREPYRVSQFVLDNVRLEAAQHWLNRSSNLSKNQREYWQGVSKTTVPANFNQGKRG